MKFNAALKLILELPLYQKCASGLSAIALATMIYGLVSLFSSTQTPPDGSSSDSPPASPPDLGHLTVDVAGAVAQPGIYTLLTGDRLAQAIQAAGGLTDQADQTQLAQSFNLAEPLSDGEKLAIPSLATQSAEQKTITSSTATNLISLNKATLEELDSLPGIGLTRAQAIIAHRPYTSLDDLVSQGILGQGVWDEIKDKVSY